MRDLKLIVFVALWLACEGPARARQIDPTKPPPPPAADAPKAAAPSAPIDPSTPPPPPPETPPEPPKPPFDPAHAAKNMEVGTFYMKKGIYDAAIDRFEDAARLQPSLAKPWKLMGEAYEKKHDYAKAVESYKKYLELFPGVEDASKVEKHVATLEQKLARETPQQPAH